jgi:hypothetical protein
VLSETLPALFRNFPKEWNRKINIEMGEQGQLSEKGLTGNFEE